MPHLPDRSRFGQLARSLPPSGAGVRRLVPVYRRLFADGLTPLSAFAKIDSGAAACLFESVVGGEKVGRYSFLASDPFLRFEARGTLVTVSGGGRDESFTAVDPLRELERRMAAFHTVRLPELPPFTSGVVGYAGYDTVRYVERLPDAPPDDRGLPDLSFGFYDHMIVFDNVTKAIDVVVLADVGDGKPACLANGTATSTFPREAFLAAVDKAIEYISAGDIFQVVLSRRIDLPFTAAPLELYRTLRVVNPSPFMFFLRTPDCTLVGSSPEIMVRCVDGTVTVRPLAGTRRRGATAEEDRALAEDLLADPKERAEHVMLIDLGRNDVGRVAATGTVSLSDVMVIERYSHVMHITSNVTGRLAEGLSAFDALRACLPAGTVSGAPKIRAMQIIDEFEPVRRGPYAGAVGYVDFNGAMDTCIALRTVVIAAGRAFVQSGAGIVADSVPELEYEETLNKAKGLLVSIEMTEERLAGGERPA